ncbi:glutamine amidotransferase [Paenarthrobacter sp. PH39-S1]|uniref:glutamine amidotransferase n=1 Tax=Paenarthrobacter sp. PH39-S1 TaxID=3046204 RepID=UPI0024B925A5|nr:glutamine amidotransferase [Paenarthrobacter sp. PH39-S1]MDJ0357597.1 glutamine amidotransferase [Paenarthrobacter sp. PH39-S1]
MMIKVLLAGESWISNSTHYKGFDSFNSVTFHTGHGPLVKALTGSDIDLTFMPGHEVAENFPSDLDSFNKFDVVIISDIGANSLLLSASTWLSSQRQPDRLELLAEWTASGGGLAMMGGYLSFQGIEGKAFYAGSAVERVLPVEISRFDDRVECPAGVRPVSISPTGGVDGAFSVPEGPWPHLLGYNKVTAKAGSQVLAEIGPDPLLVLGAVGQGRSAAWTSDISPHWCPDEFSSWDGYRTIFVSLITWLAGSQEALASVPLMNKETTNV